jgi:hypothetical protein
MTHLKVGFNGNYETTQTRLYNKDKKRFQDKTFNLHRYKTNHQISSTKHE